jgi:hypothetical protein
MCTPNGFYVTDMQFQSKLKLFCLFLIAFYLRCVGRDSNFLPLKNLNRSKPFDYSTDVIDRAVSMKCIKIMTGISNLTCKERRFYVLYDN